MKNAIYADNAATTKLDVAAFEAMKPFLLDNYSNVSQPYSFSRIAKKALNEAREIIAKCINADADEIYFTSGGTESDNWVIKGSAFLDHEKKATITSCIEHHAILNSCKSIEKLGYPVAYLPSTKEGLILPDSLKAIITNRTRLISIMMANNEIGTVEPIKELVEIAHSHKALFHTDAVQAVGHINIDVKELGVDFLSASAHKFNGPKGIGFLYIKKGVQLSQLHDGGSQENDQRAGTVDVASIVGMAVALKNNCEHLSSNEDYINNLTDCFIKQLDIRKIDYIRNGINQLPGNINISIKNMNGEMLLHRLDLMGIYVSTGSACDSVNNQVSHVIRAIGVPIEYAEGTIRISFGKYNTVDEAKKIAECLSTIINS